MQNMSFLTFHPGEPIKTVPASAQIKFQPVQGVKNSVHYIASKLLLVFPCLLKLEMPNSSQLDQNQAD